jgi:hypothetical protein
MLESIGTFVTAIKNAGPPFTAAALVATALLLFLPDNIVGQMGLTEFRAAHRSEIGAVLVGSASLLAVQILLAVGRFIKRRWRNWRFKRNARTILEQLTEAEKDFLRPFILDGENTVYESIYDGVANGLQAQGVIYRASNMSVPGQPGILFPWNLQPHARKTLNDNLYLLQ